MKGNLKRIFALVVAITVAAAMIVPAYAATEEPAYSYTDPYVIVYKGSDELSGYQDYCKPYLYASPHMSSMQIRNLETGEMESWYCSQQVYNMIDTTRLAAGGDGAYASMEVYCVDACINANGGSSYRRINLEDSVYFTDTVAGKIRAVFLNSFPYIKDMSVITANVNAWLDTQGTEHTDVADLTAAEVVTAAQYTIWGLANGADVVPQNPYIRTDSTYTADMLTPEVVYVTDSYMDCTEGARNTTANNIRMVQQYLNSLPAVGPQKTVAGDAALRVENFSKTMHDDGTYTMSVDYSTDVQLSDGDSLILTATCGSTQHSRTLTAENLTGTVELTGVKAAEDVKLEINGYQTGGDVYLYDATGNRDQSQSMVGYDSSSLPVHAEVTVDSADHILNLYKTTGEADGKRPLANISFSIYRTASMEDLASGNVTLSEEPTAAEIALYKTAENRIATVMTDAAGFATWNFTENGNPDGVYLVVEEPNAAVTGAIAPFYVAIPGTSADGTAHVNTVNVYPKNTTEVGPEIQKDVTAIENNSDTFDVGQVHTWILRGDVPAGIGEALTYRMEDTLDYRLTYQGNENVRLALQSDAAGAENITLRPDTDYILTTAQSTDAESHPVDTFTVELTQAGRQAVAQTIAAAGGAVADYELRVYFDAVINQNTQMGQQIPNQAKLDYTNALGIHYESTSDIPEVHTGGTQLLKLDSQNKAPLAGASFQIARDATEAELADDAVLKQTLTVGDTEHTVVFAAVYPTADLSGEKTDVVTTDETGAAVFYGLAYGEYYLVETKAPAGYNLLQTPITVQIDAESHVQERVITVINTRFLLPETGGIGTTVFTVTGILLILAAPMVILLTGRKKGT